MGRLRPLVTLVMALALVFSLGGCVIEDDAAITCGNFNDWLHDCEGSCSVTWDCESYYDTLSLDDQYALDDCSDCLASNPTCGDCSAAGVGSCINFMEDLLGVDCW